MSARREGRPPRRQVWTDASFRDGVAGVAGVVMERGGRTRVLFMDVLLTGSSAAGERAALERAMGIAGAAAWPRVVFRCDMEGLARATRRGGLRRGWSVEVVPRQLNRAAHVAARQALKVWEAGRDGVGTLGPRSEPAPLESRGEPRRATPRQRSRGFVCPRCRRPLLVGVDCSRGCGWRFEELAG